MSLHLYRERRNRTQIIFELHVSPLLDSKWGFMQKCSCSYEECFFKVPFWNRSKAPYGARQYRQSLKSDSQGLTEFHCSGVYNKVVSLTVVGLWPSGAQNECPWRSYSGWSIFHQCLEIHTYRQGPFPEESWQSAEAWKTVIFAQIR